MEKNDLAYTILEYTHDRSNVDYNAMLKFYCMKLMEHFKMETDQRFVELNGRKYRIKLDIFPEE